jgi:N-methylhydantoinase A
VAGVEAEAAAAMAAAGFDPAAVAFERVVLMRYAEQFLHEAPIALGAGEIDAEAIARRFDEEYARLYGEGARAIFQAVEIFGVRITARVPLGFVPSNAASANGARRMVAGERLRQVYWPEEHAWVPTAVHDGTALRAGDTLHGPAIVELPHTSVAVAASHELRVDGAGNLVLALG